MNSLPNRNDDKYKEIEQFADYKLTQCVAYEMAIRNNHVIELKNDIDKLLNLILKEYKYTRENDNKFNSEYDALQDAYDKKYFDDKYDNDNDELEVPDYHKYFLSENNNAIAIKEKLNILINKYWIRYFYEEDIINEAFHRNKEKDEEACMFFGNYLFTKQIKQLKEHNLIGIFEHVGMSKDNRVVMSSDIGFAFGMSENTAKEVDLNKILISQNLNSLVIPKEYDRSINIKLNLSLPLSELEAQIKKLKENNDADNGMIKAPIELIGTELQKADDISKMCTVNKNGKELCFDGRQGITRTQKLADMLFIYDMVKCEKKEFRIRTAISEYYENTFNKNTDMSDTTFRKYRDIAKDYIDNQRYKELITGVKS